MCTCGTRQNKTNKKHKKHKKHVHHSAIRHRQDEPLVKVDGITKPLEFWLMCSLPEIQNTHLEREKMQ